MGQAKECFEASDGRKGRPFEPGEGPSAERLHLAPRDVPPQQAEEEVLNQDGSRLGGAGGEVINPGVHEGEVVREGQLEHPSMADLPIGAEDATLREEGNRRETHPGISGGPSASDLGVSGMIGGDPSNIGMGDGEEF